MNARNVNTQRFFNMYVIIIVKSKKKSDPTFSGRKEQERVQVHRKKLLDQKHADLFHSKIITYSSVFYNFCNPWHYLYQFEHPLYTMATTTIEEEKQDHGTVAAVLVPIVEVVEADLLVPHHAKAIIELMDQYAQDPMGGGCTLSDHVKDNLIAELMKRQSTTRIILAFATSTTTTEPTERKNDSTGTMIPVGLAICFVGFSTFACQSLLNIHDLMVHPKYRKCGICQQLLSKVQEIGKELQCCKITLEVLEYNHPAHLAYRKFGFAPYELNPEMGRALFWQKKI